MDLAFIADQLGTFETFGKAIHGLFTGFADFAYNMNTMINGVDKDGETVNLTGNTKGVFEALSSKSAA